MPGMAGMAAEGDDNVSVVGAVAGSGGGHDDGKSKFPTGFRFKPTDEELVEFYLLRKLQGRPTVANHAIIEANVYEFHPETLVYEKYRDRGEGAWFFLSPPARMYKGSRRTRRTGDGCGWWKSSHSVRFGVIGDITFSKNSFKYFSGTLKNGQKTKWIMREFTVPEYMVKRGSNSATLDEYVLCKIYLSPRKVIKDEAGATSVCGEAKRCPAVTAESELSVNKAGKRPQEVQSRRCATACWKRPRQGSLAIGPTQALPRSPSRKHMYLNDIDLAGAVASLWPLDNCNPDQCNSMAQAAGSEGETQTLCAVKAEDQDFAELAYIDMSMVAGDQGEATAAFAVKAEDEDFAELAYIDMPLLVGDQGEATAAYAIKAKDEDFTELAYIDMPLVAGDQGEATAAYEVKAAEDEDSPELPYIDTPLVAGNQVETTAAYKGSDSICLELDWDEFFLEDLVA